METNQTTKQHGTEGLLICPDCGRNFDDPAHWGGIPMADIEEQREQERFSIQSEGVCTGCCDFEEFERKGLVK